MYKKGVPKTEEEKRLIGLGNKGIHLNKTNSGILVYKDGKKLCPVCNEWKLLAEYDKRPERPIGVKPKCKQCVKIYRANNPEMVKYAMYKSGALKRGFSFELSKEEFMIFWKNPCFYCNSAIDTIGLDRIDSNIGYKLDNIIPCCTICNTMKLALPRNIFIEHCRKIVNNTAIIPD